MLKLLSKLDKITQSTFLLSKIAEKSLTNWNFERIKIFVIFASFIEIKMFGLPNFFILFYLNNRRILTFFKINSITQIVIDCYLSSLVCFSEICGHIFA